MKKIVLMPVKNEEWILEQALHCASLFADHIILIDQNSTDATPQICKKFPKLVYIKNPSDVYNEGQHSQQLLDAARQYDGHNFIIKLAADEVLSANILAPGAFERLTANALPGCAFSMQWVQLWKRPDVYRDDNSVWSRHYRAFAFIDDRKSNYKQRLTHMDMIPADLIPAARHIEEFKVLHYQFTDWPRMLLKQCWARLLEFDHNPSHAFMRSVQLNNKYFITKDETGLKVVPVPKQWSEGYPEFKVKAFDLKQDWHSKFCLEAISKYGPENLKWLDIWDLDWQPDFKDPRGFLQKFYHSHQAGLGRIYSSTPEALKKLIKIFN